MIERGRVTSVDGDIAEISIVPGEACSSCPVYGSCQHNEGLMTIRARNAINARSGDIVRIEIAEKSGLGAALVIFGLPIVLALIGLIISTGFSEITRVLITVSGLIAGLVIAKVIDHLVKNRPNVMPWIVDKES